jgi:uncharacterized repeat protein (TIGR01451 family)
MNIFKKFSLSLYVMVFMGSVSFAQSILWWQWIWSVDSNQRWYFDQSRKTQPSTPEQCVWVNNNVRYYLSSDYDQDGLFDYKLDYRLRDNFWTTWGPDSVKLALITARIPWSSVGTDVSYYTASPNILSVYANNQNYNIDSTKSFYRVSNIAPKDIYVRAVSSEPLLFEIPSSKNPTDARFQVSYNIRFKDYDSIKPSWESTYVAYKIPNSSFGEQVTSSDAWYLNSLSPWFDSFYGPNWPANYTNWTSFTTRSIQWQEPEKTHALECHNGYLSRCWDGYIDVSNQQPTNGSTTQPYPISDSGVSETCDPGANLSSYADDVMPNGATPTASYNCTATCTINSTPSLTIDKQQKLASSPNYEAVGLGTLSNIQYTSPAAFDFKIIITNNGGNATNVVMNDTLPTWFTMNALPWWCSGVLSNGTQVACNAQAGTSLTSQPFNLAAGQTATFIVKGILLAWSPTTNSVYASYTNPSNNTTINTPTDTVNQFPYVAPILVYTKTVRNVTTNSNNGQFVEADNIGSAVVIKTWDAVQYQITINRTGWPVTNTILSDVLPSNNWFLLSAYSINWWAQISATSFPATNITTLLNVGSVVVTLFGTVGSPTAESFVNTATLTDPAYPAGVPTLTPGSNVAWTKLDNTPPPRPDVSIRKEVEVSPNSNTRQELSTVTSGQTVRFKITYRNISSVNAINALVTDTLPTGLTCISAIHQDGVIIPCVNNGISYTEPVMNPWVEKFIILTVTVNSALPSGVTTNTANIQLPGDPIKSDPAQVQPQSITDFIVTKRILSWSVIPGTVIKYEIGFRNTGNAPISSYTLTDPLQNSTYVAGSSRLNNSILITPAYIGNLLTRWCNSTNTALNGQTVCPLLPWTSGTIVFDVLVN